MTEGERGNDGGGAGVAGRGRRNDGEGGATDGERRGWLQARGWRMGSGVGDRGAGVAAIAAAELSLFPAFVLAALGWGLDQHVQAYGYEEDEEVGD